MQSLKQIENNLKNRQEEDKMDCEDDGYFKRFPLISKIKSQINQSLDSNYKGQIEFDEDCPVSF